MSNNVFSTFQAIRIFLNKFAERSRDIGRRSRDIPLTVKYKFFRRSNQTSRRWRDRRPTVKQRFLDVSSNLGWFWKKSLNGHATVVGGHATIGRLSNNVLWTFQAIWENLKKSRWTVTRQWSEVTRPSADCQTTFFRRFKQLEKILKKVAERSRDSGRRSRDRRLTVKPRFLNVSSNLGEFWKKSLNSHATVVGGHATIGRLSNNVFWTFQAIRKLFVKSHWRVTRQWSVVTRLSADCQAHICMYIIINEREIERERERERERKSERERERERPNTTLHLDGESLTKRQKSGKKIYPTIFPFVDSCPISLGFSRELPANDMWYYVAYVHSGELVPSWGINELELARQNQKFSSSYP